jgi:predicted amidohydrolase YtcJ
VQALVVKGNKILSERNNADIDAYIGDGTEVIDLEGKLAVPVLIDGYAT